MRRILFIAAVIAVLATLLNGCGKGELDITLRTPEGADEPTQPTDLRIGNQDPPVACEVAPIIFTWKAAQDRSGTGIKGYWVSIDSTDDWTWVEGATNWTSTNPLSEGPHVLRVKAEDHAGHEGSYASLLFEVELGRPDIVITDLSYNPPNPKVGDKLTISVTVRNQGDATGWGNAGVCLDDTRPLGPTPRFDELAPASETAFTVEWTLTRNGLHRWPLAGDHQIIAIVQINSYCGGDSDEKAVPITIAPAP